MDDTFLSVTRAGTAETRVRGSRFIGYAAGADTEEETQKVVAEARRRWHDARHHCFAFRLGPAGDVFRANDDGEPGGTAGTPILQQIESRGLTNTVAVVTRYFGGTKLGRGGLARAYAEAAGLALDAAAVKEHVISELIRLEFRYDDTAAAMRAIEAIRGKIVDSSYSDVTTLDVEVRVSLSDAFRNRFVEDLAGRGDLTVLRPR